MLTSRIKNGLGWEEPLRASNSNLHAMEDLSLNQAAKHPIQPGPEHFYKWASTTPLGSASHLHNKQFLTNISPNLLPLSLPIHPCSITMCPKKLFPIFLVGSLEVLEG